MKYLAVAWKLVSSRPFLAVALVAFGWLYFQEWRTHRATAAIRAEHYVTVTTKEASTWETTRFICAGGPVSLATGLSDAEIKRLARQHGLILTETITVQGEDRLVEVPIFRSESGSRVRLFSGGEKVIEPAPWGGKALGGVDESGALWLDFDPAEEPFRERLAAFGWFIKAGYVFDEGRGSLAAQANRTETRFGGGVSYEWRRWGRWVLAPEIEADWGPTSGVRVEAAARLTRRDLPVRLRP